MALLKMRRLFPSGHLFDAFEVTGKKGDHIIQKMSHTIPYEEWTQTTIWVEGEAENWKRKPGYNNYTIRPQGFISCERAIAHDGDGTTIEAGVYEIICRSPSIRYYCIRPAEERYSSRLAVRMKEKETRVFKVGDFFFLAGGSVTIGKKVYSGPHLIEVTSPEVTVKAKNDILGVVFRFDASKSLP